VARRFAALAGFVAVLVLAALLLYRVYVHHTQAEPYVDDDDGAIVSVETSLRPDVKIASASR
jgi:hypothetical protein